MRQHEAIETLKGLDRNGRRVFTHRDFAKLFREDEARTLSDGIDRLINKGVLIRPARGIYVYEWTERERTHLLHEVARTLRRGFHTYLSLESALSEYGVISQVPSGHHTFMTTGRKGEFRTPYGSIEFTHTSRDPSEFISDLCDNGRPLPIATVDRAYRDLKRVGRNLGMVDPDELREELERANDDGGPDAGFF